MSHLPRGRVERSPITEPFTRGSEANLLRPYWDELEPGTELSAVFDIPEWREPNDFRNLFYKYARVLGGEVITRKQGTQLRVWRKS